MNKGIYQWGYSVSSRDMQNGFNQCHILVIGDSTTKVNLSAQVIQYLLRDLLIFIQASVSIIFSRLSDLPWWIRSKYSSQIAPNFILCWMMVREKQKPKSNFLYSSTHLQSLRNHLPHLSNFSWDSFEILRVVVMSF